VRQVDSLANSKVSVLLERSLMSNVPTRVNLLSRVGNEVPDTVHDRHPFLDDIASGSQLTSPL
jgi:hypothetical protein